MLIPHRALIGVKSSLLSPCEIDPEQETAAQGRTAELAPEASPVSPAPPRTPALPGSQAQRGFLSEPRVGLCFFCLLLGLRPPGGLISPTGQSWVFPPLGNFL